jgi:hypothetical protein
MSSPEPQRAEGLEVAVARVGRSGGRARWAAIAWGAALVALVAIAIGDRPAEQATPPVAVALPVPGLHADPGPTPSAIPRPRRVVRAAAPRERTTGEDGLMGSLVFDFRPDVPIMQSWPVGKLGWTTNPAQS